jgi:acyl-CoA reductase-like NAD-dependent aldehyde dehydrogenase
MVRAAYSSGKPAYGVGAGNATMVIDDSADVAEAAKNSAISKTNDHGSGCSRTATSSLTRPSTTHCWRGFRRRAGTL